MIVVLLTGDMKQTSLSQSLVAPDTCCFVQRVKILLIRHTFTPWWVCTIDGAILSGDAKMVLDWILVVSPHFGLQFQLFMDLACQIHHLAAFGRANRKVKD